MTFEFPLLAASLEFGHCIAYADSENSVPYQQLWSDVQDQAFGLSQAGVGVGDRVAWVTENDYQTVVRFWAIWLAGAIACPLSHRLPDAKRQEVLSQLEATLFDVTLGLTVSEGASELSDGFPIYDPQRPATIVLSSGSTGVPKAIVHNLRAHIANAEGAAERIALSAGDRWLWALPPFHVGGLAVIVRCAMSGATVFGVSNRNAGLAELLEASACTHVSLVPTQLQRLLDSGADLSSLRAILLGGTAIASSLLHRAIELSLPIHKTYGLTEMASQVTTTERLTTACEHSGSSMKHREFRIAENTNEVLVRGETLCVGCLRDSQIENVVDEDGWFHTRDRGEVTAAGHLVVLGRIDNMFISGGENIYPEAIESKLLQIDDIRQAVVVAKNDEEFGARPVAYVDADELQVAVWREALSRELAKFEIPVAFLRWPEETMLAIKPDRKRLAELANQVD